MNQHRRLTLKREALAELTAEDLTVVNAAAGGEQISLPHPVCVLLYHTNGLSCGCGA